MPKNLQGVNLTEPIRREFGCWTSHSIVLDSPTHLHRDLDDTVWGFCCIVPQGSFEGGYLCLPSLGIKIACPQGTVIFLRSYILPHYISDFTGTRVSFISFTHQEVVNWYLEKKNEWPYPWDSMPKWWKDAYQEHGGKQPSTV